MKKETAQPGGSILIVEDDRGISELEGQRLEPLGLRILRASAAAEAAEILKHTRPDLMVLDYSLRGMNALDLVALLKKGPAQVPPFIVVTGRGDEAVAVQSMKAGALDYIVKDAAFLDNLLPTARKALEKAALQLRLREAEEGVRRNLRLYNFLAEVNRAAAREKDRRKLLSAICEIAVAAGGLKLAWVGEPDRDVGRVLPLCSAGGSREYLNSLRADLTGGKRSAGPEAEAAINGEAAVSPDIAGDFGSGPWREQALKAGFRSAAAIPLLTGNKVSAVLCLYSAEPLFFSRDELKLLGEIRADLELALEAIETEKKRGSAQAALLRTAAELAHVMEASPVILFRLRFISGHLVTEWISGNAQGITGYETAEILDPAWFAAALHPQDKDRVLAGRASLAEKGGIAMDFRVKKKGNGHVWVHGQLRMVSSEEAIGSWTDITPLKQAEAELAGRNRLLASILDNSPSAIFALDLEGKILLANRAAARILNSEPEALIGKNRKSFLPAETEEALRKNDLKILESGKPAAFEEETGEADGTHYYQASKFPLLDELGKPYALCGISTDITEAKRARRLLKDAADLRRIESLGDLAGGIAHGFNNMLAGIMANLSLLESRCGEDREMLEILGETLEAAKNARSLATNLLAFSKGGKPVKKEFSLKRALGESFKLATAGANSDCAILAPETLWSVEGDENQLKQAVNNLLLNALQAMPSGGTLRLQAQNTADADSLAPEHLTPGKYVKITVADTGIGIPEKDLPRLFEPYFTTKSRGRGLGLAMALTVIKNHGGRITVSSAPGKGTSFDVYLPATGRNLTEEPEARKTIPAGSGRVLVLEDEPVVYNALRRMLAGLGYGCEIVTDGKDAVRRYAEEEKRGDPFAAVILDLVIPGGMGGREAALQLRKLAPEARLIVSSGYSDDAVLADHKANGFDAVLPKPYRYEDLAEALAGLLRGGND
ncbi:MAG: response regulator [Elusimicrobia bacterium]|nr:response regulator [Elusimicrobiota bacterium]